MRRPPFNRTFLIVDRRLVHHGHVDLPIPGRPARTPVGVNGLLGDLDDERDATLAIRNWIAFSLGVLRARGDRRDRDDLFDHEYAS